jgi:small subunit ribosomal protein S16
MGGVRLSVRIRLRRVGAKKQPSYRVVVADSRAPRDGRFIDAIGFYNPRTTPTTITIDEEKARKWLSQGALPTESVASLLYRAGIVDMRSARYRKEGDVLQTQGAAAATAEPQPTEAPAESATSEEIAAGEAELAAES